MTALIELIQDNLPFLLGKGIPLLLSLIAASLCLVFTRYLANSSRRVVALGVAQRIESSSLRLLIVQTTFVGVWTLGGLVAAMIAFPDLRLGDIIGLLGLGSVAIGFAFQDIFKNFLAGVLLLLESPFQIGDQIQVGDFEGEVDEITIRATQIHTYQGERILIPNSIVFTSELKVYTALPYRRTDLAIGLDYNTNLAEAVTILREATTQVPLVLSDPPLEVDLVGFGDSSIDFMVRYWTMPKEKNIREAQTQVILALKQACDRHDLRIPYPIRTVYGFDQQQFLDYQPQS
ncbi:MAG: mechanosensitive ion channel family protein [Prochlorotrichaceae cyanobacterium]|jgi:small-conductance mechanosensitive channel